MFGYIKKSQEIEISKYLKSQKSQNDLYKRTVIIIMISQIFSGAGITAGVMVGALLAQSMLQTDTFSGMPMAIFTLGSAFAALLIGFFTQKTTRRFGLSLGYILASFGAVGVIFSAIYNNVYMLFIFLFIYGFGTASNLQARYAGTDLATKAQRATAVSMAMVSTTLGAVFAPHLTQLMSGFATNIGVPSLAGPFILAAFGYGVAGLVIFLYLRPDSFLISKHILKNQENSGGADENLEMDTKGVTLGTIIMVFSQFVMVSLMTMTPIYMKANGFGLKEIGLVISLHIGSMYFPSLITGVIIDKVGHKKMSIFAGIILFISALILILSPSNSLILIITALCLLGIGWNLGIVSGTAIVVDSTVISSRAKIQGLADLFIAIFGSIAGFISGVIVGKIGFMTLFYLGIFLSIILIGIVIISRKIKYE